MAILATPKLNGDGRDANMKKLVMFATIVVALGLMLPAVASAADTGPDIFAAKCAGCHGKDGSGNTAMGKSLKLRDLGSADVQKMSDKELTDIVEKGKPPKMPAYGGKLSSAQIDDLVKYIRSLKK